MIPLSKELRDGGFYPVRNNAPLLPPGQRPSGPAAAAGLDFRIIPAGFNAPLGFESQRLEFLTGFTEKIKYCIQEEPMGDYLIGAEIIETGDKIGFEVFLKVHDFIKERIGDIF